MLEQGFPLNRLRMRKFLKINRRRCLFKQKLAVFAVGYCIAVIIDVITTIAYINLEKQQAHLF